MNHGLNTLEDSAEQRRRRGRFWLPLSLAWFLTLTGPISDLFSSDLSSWWIAAALMLFAAFVVIYYFVLLRNLHAFGPQTVTVGPRWRPIAALLAIATALTIGFGPPWMGIFVFVSSAAGIYVAPERAIRIVLAVTAVAAGTGVIAGASLSTLAGYVLIVLSVGLLMWSVTNVMIAYRELRAAREGLAKLAVAEERLRFARDLHDLIGHNLSVIALKSELAGKLVAQAPDRAIKEINDIEAVSRRSLQDIRGAVSAYRQPTLEQELRGAREILEAAGIALDLQIWTTLPTDAEAPFAWALREGITNVIRHSRALHCAVRLTESHGVVSLEIVDDGDASGPVLDSGSGLHGIRERFSAVGGAVETGVNASGGFRLIASAPVKRVLMEAAR